jgi:hypothetical protein
MIQLSDRLLAMEESATIAMAKKSRELKSQGKDVISLSLGEPDFYTPQFIKDAAVEALEQNYTMYTPVPGYDDLRESISLKFKRDNGLDYAKDQIVVSTGAKQSIANVVLSLINPGDEVISPAPYWVSYVEIVKVADEMSEKDIKDFASTDTKGLPVLSVKVNLSPSTLSTFLTLTMSDVGFSVSDFFCSSVNSPPASFKASAAAISACNVSFVDPIISDRLHVSISGASDIKGSVKVNSLKVGASGASNISLSGTATESDFNISGACSIKSLDLVTDNCAVVASGASSIKLTINQSLRSNISGASDIRYKGTVSRFDTKSSGASSIKPL